MNIAIAQIDMRLGDIEAICARIESQAVLAHEQGARLLCTSMPLFAGATPTPLVEETNYVHDLITSLEGMAHRLERLGMMALVPAFASFQGAPVFELFLLKEGNVVPLRTLLAFRRAQTGEDDAWLTPVFDVDGVRCAVALDAERIGDQLPPGCDLVIYFQTSPLDITQAETSAVAAIADDYFRPAVTKRSVWLACVAPVGSYDRALFAGGSFVMDDCGRVVAAAPCFEEALLVQDVQRGMTLPCLEDHELPRFERTEWLWNALRLGLVDEAAAQGTARAALVLEGDLPSSLTAALCVDAFGPRNVVGLLIARAHALTPAQDAAERERTARVRELADALHIRLVERTEPDAALLFDRDTWQAPTPAAAAEAARTSAHLAQLYLDEVAHAEHALPVSSLTKTDYALAPHGLAGSVAGEVAPFGDVYLTALEFVARMRNRAGAAVPAGLVSLRGVQAYLAQLEERAASLEAARPAYAQQMCELLASLEPSQIDGVLEAHVDRGVPFEDIPLASTRPNVVALLLMLVRRGEAARRTLPRVPAVSARSFEERAWPADLAWSDMGRHGMEPVDLEDVARATIERAEQRGEEAGARMRNEVMSFVSSLLGITPEQLEAMSTDEGREQLGSKLPQLEDQVQQALRGMFEGSGAGGSAGGGPGTPGSHGFSFFAQN